MRSNRLETLARRLPAALAALLAAGLVGGLPAAHAQGYPDRPLRLIAPFSAGSGTDAAARLLAEGLTRELKQPVVVENKPGANTMIGTTFAAKSAPDGYTLTMIFADNMLINPVVYKDLQYAVSDLDPVAIVGQVPMVIVGASHLPYDSMEQLRQASVKEGKSFNLGTWGNGSVAHVVGAMLAQEGKFKFEFIPFSGAAPSATAVMGGHVDLAVLAPTNALSMVKAGKVKALAVGSESRLAELPDTETLKEAGLGKVSAVQWHGLAVRAGGDQKIIDTLAGAVSKIYADPAYHAKFMALGYARIGGMTPAQYRRFIQEQDQIWRPAILASGIAQQ